jgi:hypothetical protein
MHARLIGAVVVAAVVGSAATAWAASAANPVNKSTGVIAACYATSGGALRVATTTCKATETAVSWQIGAVPLRADIAAGAPDAQLLSKDGLKMRLACYVNPGGVWTAELHVVPSGSADINGSYIAGDELGSEGPTEFGMTAAAKADVVPVAVGRSGGGFARGEGEMTIDTPSHIVTVVFHVIANSVTDRCQVAATATLT